MNEGTPDSTALSADHRTLDFRALGDLIVVMVSLVAVKQALLPYSFLYAGPASTFSAMLIGTYLLQRRGLSWKDLGLRRPDSWLKTAGLTLLTIFCFALAMEMMEIVADHFFEDKAASGRFDHIQGNLGAYLVIMLFTWTHASFFEELLFRAFIIDKASRFLGGGNWANLSAAIFSAIFFGYRHYYYQGMNGALTTGAAGMAFALLYLWFGRKNIFPLAFAHGIVNSIGMTLRFFGVND